MAILDKQIHRNQLRLRILITDGCNQSCKWCLNDFQKKPKGVFQMINRESVTSAIYAYKRFCNSKKLPTLISFSGGEPGIHPKLSRFGSVIYHNSVDCFMINTNGTVLFRDDFDSFRTYRTEFRVSTQKFNPPKLQLS